MSDDDDKSSMQVERPDGTVEIIECEIYDVTDSGCLYLKGDRKEDSYSRKVVRIYSRVGWLSATPGINDPVK